CTCPNRAALFSYMGRIPQLDILRAIAVLMVIGFHYHYDWLLDRTGWAGVDLFFVLSGFLISGVLFIDEKRTGTISLKRFYYRRSLKIYPAYFFFLLLTAICFPQVRSVLGLQDIFFLQSYFKPAWIHTWSLAVEEHFYFLLPPLLLLLISRRKLGLIPFISLALLALCLTLRILAWAVRPTLEHVAYPSHLRMDSLFAGVALGYLFHYRGEIFHRFRGPKTLALGLCALLPIVALPRETGFNLTCGLTFATVGFAALLAWSVNHPALRFRPVEQIGQYSYSIYLWHYVVVSYFRAFPKTPAHYLLYCAITAGVGIAMAEIIEIPCLRLRDHFAPNRRRFTVPGLAVAESPAAEPHPRHV
ncbi:MAG TPA: acyltransferase, partial [Nitrospira sp.]|nr:acyltransferase [Nitrospira sp.]